MRTFVIDWGKMNRHGHELGNWVWSFSDPENVAAICCVHVLERECQIHRVVRLAHPHIHEAITRATLTVSFNSDAVATAPPDLPTIFRAVYSWEMARGDAMTKFFRIYPCVV